MYIVLWTEVDCPHNSTSQCHDCIDKHTDHWVAEETYKGAQAEYERVRNLPTIYSASIAQPIVSTDYSTCDCDHSNDPNHDKCEKCGVLLCYWGGVEENRFDPVNTGLDEEYYCDDCYNHADHGCPLCTLDANGEECEVCDED